ncbi:VCBS domain-containing protein, partial [Hydrogenophaga sp. RWCD_12]|uniref:VCBS domain-containing protein n=1 Tax=Hydrogenophaga sp. RWCD_12 TaxID=3391190 RepID=UPI003984E82A
AQNTTALTGSGTGSYGTVSLNADGTYTYTLDNANTTVQQLAPGETLAETYTYVLTDKDGDTSTATLTIT